MVKHDVFNTQYRVYCGSGTDLIPSFHIRLRHCFKRRHKMANVVSQTSKESFTMEVFWVVAFVPLEISVSVLS
jgi:hypothetical protein